MKAPWSPYFQLKELDEEEIWDGIPPKPGIYVVKSGRRIPRLAGNDARTLKFTSQGFEKE